MARYVRIPPASRELLDKIQAGLPEYFPRAHIARWTNGLFTADYMEYLRKRGEGPALCYIGKKSVITKEAFVDWLKRMYYNEGEQHGSNPETDGSLPEGLES